MNSQNPIFVLRVKIWLEQSDTKPSKSEWRGEIKQLETGKVAYFQYFSGFADGLSKLGILEDVILDDKTPGGYTFDTSTNGV